jgi:hypothetical protein
MRMLLGSARQHPSPGIPAERLDRFASFARTGADRAFLEHSRMRGVIVLAYNRGRTKAYSERDAGKPTGKTSVVYISQAVHELTGIIEATIQQMVRAVTHGIQTKGQPSRSTGIRSLL